MTDPRYIGTILYVGLAIFAALLAAGLLMQERRRSVQRTALLWGAEGLILLLDLYLCFGLLPAPLRLPVSLTVGFLSYSAVFIAVSADGFWKKVYLLITFFCVCCISWSGGLYLCYFLLPDRPIAVKYLVRTALHIVTALPILLAYRKYGRPLLREVSGFQKQSWKLLSAVSAIYFFLFIALMSRIRLDDGVEPDTLFVFCAAVCTYASVSVLSIGNIFYMRRDAREALVKQKLEYLASYMETVSRAERESRRIRHDKRHHDACIAAMARVGDTDGILRYLEQEQETVELSRMVPAPHGQRAAALLRRKGEGGGRGVHRAGGYARAVRRGRRGLCRHPREPSGKRPPCLHCSAQRRPHPRPHPKRREKDGPRGEQPLRQLEAGKRPARGAERRDRQHRFRRRALSG